ncbi:MAG TPA: TonB family protein, partial [Polyangia bacterium]
MKRAASWALTALLVCAPRVGHGQADAGPASFVAPVPLELPAITTPAGAPPLVGVVTVDVVLTVDETGAVIDVQVVRGAGAPFDDAVVAGVKRFRFAPAQKDGQAVAVRIPFAQSFRPAPPRARADADAVLEGLVLSRGTRDPVTAASLVAVDTKTKLRYAGVSDRDGVFRLSVPSGTTLDLFISADQHEAFVQRETLERNQRLQVKYLLRRESFSPYQSYVRAETDRTEVSRTTLSGRELTQVPGTFGDPFRAVHVLPGVSQLMSLLPMPIVRGASPGNTGTLLDGARIPLLFHLLAGPSVIHPELIDHMDFYPGGFPVRYGGYTGGIIDGTSKRSARGERRIELDANLAQTGLLVREPFGSVDVTAAGRIGYPGLLLQLFTDRTTLSYWDYQLRADGRAGNGRYTAFFYGAEDELSEREGAAGPWKNSARFAFHRADFRFHRGSDSVGEVYRLLFAYDDTRLSDDQTGEVASDNPLSNGTRSIQPQIVIRRSPWTWLDVSLGLESTLRFARYRPVAPPADGAAMPSPTDRDGLFTVSSVYSDVVIKAGERLRLIPGVRGDLYDERRTRMGAYRSTTRSSVDPRLMARLRMHESAWLKAVVGRYHQ